MADNAVHIIGGKWKGRKLRFPAANGLRPTLGRTRESLFNWLAGELHHARCLDLFAGSGALGFEALSRGAASMTFVEKNRNVATALKDNIEQLQAVNADVFSLPAKRFLPKADAPWDIIFLDPPFASSEFQEALDAIRQYDLLLPDGLVYFERPRLSPLCLSDHWQVRKAAHAGETQFGLLAPSRSQSSDHTLSA